MSRVFGRKKPRKFSLSKEKKIFRSPFFFNGNHNSENLNIFFKTFKYYELEIGFGRGENIIQKAKNNPDRGFIGCDPHLRGHLEILKFIEKSKIMNILISDLSFENIKLFLKKKLLNVYILFPDPWPKKRHKKRRLINDQFVNDISKLVRSSGNILLSSDNHDYIKQIYKCFSSNSSFILDLESKGVCAADKFNLVKTKYYFKARTNGLNPQYIQFRKK